MGRSFKKVPSVESQKFDFYKKGTSNLLPEKTFKRIIEKFKKYCLKKYGK